MSWRAATLLRSRNRALPPQLRPRINASSPLRSICRRQLSSSSRASVPTSRLTPGNAVVTALAVAGSATVYHLFNASPLEPVPLTFDTTSTEDNYSPPSADTTSTVSNFTATNVDFSAILDGISANLSDDIIESSLWAHAATFCPPVGDATGIARVDGASVPVHMPPEDNLTSSFIPLPTHTMHLFGVFDGEQGGGTSSFLSSTLLIALAGLMIDLLKKHGYGNFGDSEEAESEVYLSSGDGARTTSDMAPIPFTPDIVRPIPDDSAVEELIRSTFLLVDDWLVVEPATAFFSTVDARRAEALSKAPSSSSGNEASKAPPPLTDGLGFKEESTHALRDGQSGSSALVGYYESDTKKVRIALVGDSRAVLGRPVMNRQYQATPNSRSSVASISPSSTPVTREEPTAIVDPSKPSSPPSNAWWPFSSSQPSNSQNEERFLEPLKKTEYPTLYEAQVLTEEHTPANPKERARIVAEHPSCHQHLFSRNDDPYSTHPNDERYLGIPTTRGFGYGALKWGRDVQERLHREFLGDQPLKEFSEGRVPWPEGARKESEDSGADSSSSSSLSHTMSTPQVSTPGDPTYLRALPTVTTLSVQPGDFVVLGSKGLWECLSSDEVVGLVGAWVEERRRAMGSKTSATPEPGAASLVRELTSQSPSSISRKLTSIRDPASLMGFNSDGADSSAVLGTNLALPLRGGAPKTNRLVNPTELPVVKESGWSPRSGVAANDGWRWTRSWRVSKDKVKYIVDGRDLECVSVHILRNALGGADKDLRGGLLGMASPRAARFRDDISVQVIFFE